MFQAIPKNFDFDALFALEFSSHRALFYRSRFRDNRA